VLGVVDEEAWAARVQKQRANKDEAFSQPGSPVEGQDFEGLTYFGLDNHYRFLVDLVEEDPVVLKIPRTGGDEVEYTRVGHFVLNFPDGPEKLAGYSSEAYGKALWVPFRDATSGTESYGAGRYVEAKALQSGRWYVDLNLAYHPYCAYNEAFTCPMVPFENHLKVAVPVGEKLGPSVHS
jgi:uncharacterized protein (DUF1684 family)